VYVFLRNSGGADAFGLAAILVRSVPYAGGSLGRAVAVSGDVVAASVLPLSPNTGEGEVLVFARNQGGADVFGQVRRLTTCTSAVGTNYFGRSVSLSGDLLASGDLADPSRAGSACVFGRNQGGTDAWGLLKKVPLPESISNPSYGDDFGDAVSISGDTLAVGAWGRNEGGQFRSGAAYVFPRISCWAVVHQDQFVVFFLLEIAETVGEGVQRLPVRFAVRSVTARSCGRSIASRHLGADEIREPLAVAQGVLADGADNRGLFFGTRRGRLSRFAGGFNGFAGRQARRLVA
jgi:hypothetical protein